MRGTPTLVNWKRTRVTTEKGMLHLRAAKLFRSKSLSLNEGMLTDVGNQSVAVS